MQAALARLQGGPDPSLGFEAPSGVTMACCALSNVPAAAGLRVDTRAGGSWQDSARTQPPSSFAGPPQALAETVGLSGGLRASPAGSDGGSGGQRGSGSGQHLGTGFAVDLGKPPGISHSGVPPGPAASAGWVFGDPEAPAPGVVRVPAYRRSLAADPLDMAAAMGGAAEGGAAAEDAQLQPQALQRVWTQAVPTACHLAVADGVAAVACLSGVLLLLDADTGALIRCAHATGLTHV